MKPQRYDGLRVIWQHTSVTSTIEERLIRPTTSTQCQRCLQSCVVISGSIRPETIFLKSLTSTDPISWSSPETSVVYVPWLETSTPLNVSLNFYMVDQGNIIRNWSMSWNVKCFPKGNPTTKTRNVIGSLRSFHLEWSWVNYLLLSFRVSQIHETDISTSINFFPSENYFSCHEKM